jgi:inorganic pyrophosphatase
MVYTVKIETTKGSFAKYRADGGVDFLSPIPCPFNYGCIEGSLSQDGDDLDAILLGPRLQPGQKKDALLIAVVLFQDAGVIDDKLILRTDGSPLSSREKLQIGVFFHCYAIAKRTIHLLRGEKGATHFLGFGSLPRSPQTNETPSP